jgi:four helix bundle protein
MQNFRNLDVWRYSHALTLHSYRATARPTFPKSELFGLVSQIRRAAASVGANIAEGCGRYGNPELARFLQIAMGSASELEYHFLLAKDLGMLAESEYKLLNDEATRVKKMLSAFINGLNTRHKSSISN